MNSINLENQKPNSSNYVELENQFILRMPTIKSENGTLKLHPATQALREALSEHKTQEDSNKEPLKDRLFIELNPDTRKGRIKFDNEIFEARLVDLPCIIESLKTTDRKMFYKSSDISQMLIIKTKDDPFSNSEEEKDNKKNKKQLSQVEAFNRKYQWPHGIAPPLKNVRRKRFRKCAKKKTIDYSEIEAEVKKLFRGDREAVKIDFEVCYVEADQDEDNDETKIMEKHDDFDSEDEDNMDKNKSHNEGFKSKSNFSTEDVNDDTSSVMSKPNLLKSDDASNMNTNNNLNYEEASNDVSNLRADTTNKNRTNFKNIFVKDVIGDLSSSDDENDEDEEDAEDEEEYEDEFQSKSGNSKSKQTASGLFGDDSVSNYDDVKNQTQNEYENDESYSNIDSTVNKSKFNEYGLGDDDSDETDNDIEKKESVNMETDDTSSNFNKKSSNKEDLSMSSPSSNDNKAELNTKLNKLMDELERIQEERKKREIEINQINNPVLKAHLSSRLKNLIEEENKKKNEIEELKEMLN